MLSYPVATFGLCPPAASLPWKYREHQAQIVIATGDVLHGSLPRRELKLVQNWTELHRNELAGDWGPLSGASHWLASRHCHDRALRDHGRRAPRRALPAAHLPDGFVGDVDFSERFKAATGPMF